MHLSEKGRHYLRVKGWKTIFKANRPKNQAGVAIVVSNKINFQSKDIKNIRNDTSYWSKEKKSTKMNSQFRTSMPQMQRYPYS